MERWIFALFLSIFALCLIINSIFYIRKGVDTFLTIQKDIIDSKHINKRFQMQDQMIEQVKYRGMEFSPREIEASAIVARIVEKDKPHFIGFRTNAMSLYDKLVKSKIYQFVNRIPKAALLHIHLGDTLPAQWFLEKAKNDTDLYLDIETESILAFSKTPLENYRSILEISDNEDKIRSLFELHPNDTENSNIWTIFMSKFFNRITIYSRKVYFEEYLEAAFKLLIEENYLNIQFKFDPSEVIDENGHRISGEEVFEMVLNVQNKLKVFNESLILGIIYEGYRVWNPDDIKIHLSKAYALKKKYQDLIVSYDLSASESLLPIQDYFPILVENYELQQKEGVNFPFTIHAGENIASKIDTLTYMNLLPNAKRMGHGINLFKFAGLMDDYRDKGICIEINPISNNVLAWIKDLALHPGITYHNHGIPIVISSDDPGTFKTNSRWEYITLIMVFEFNLKDLKRVILNSIECSLLSNNQLKSLKTNWEKQWNEFISYVLTLAE